MFQMWNLRWLVPTCEAIPSLKVVKLREGVFPPGGRKTVLEWVLVQLVRRDN